MNSSVLDDAIRAGSADPEHRQETVGTQAGQKPYWATSPRLEVRVDARPNATLLIRAGSERGARRDGRRPVSTSSDNTGAGVDELLHDDGAATSPVLAKQLPGTASAIRSSDALNDCSRGRPATPAPSGSRMRKFAAARSRSDAVRMTALGQDQIVARGSRGPRMSSAVPGVGVTQQPLLTGESLVYG
jgi:hypothetical protein